MKVTIEHDAGCEFREKLGGCTCAINSPDAVSPIVADHGFVPIRSDPGNCNVCGMQRALHTYKQQN